MFRYMSGRHYFRTNTLGLEWGLGRKMPESNSLPESNSSPGNNRTPENNSLPGNRGGWEWGWGYYNSTS